MPVILITLDLISSYDPHYLHHKKSDACEDVGKFKATSEKEQ